MDWQVLFVFLSHWFPFLSKAYEPGGWGAAAPPQGPAKWFFRAIWQFSARKIARLPRIFRAKLIQPPLKKSARTPMIPIMCEFHSHENSTGLVGCHWFPILCPPLHTPGLLCDSSSSRYKIWCTTCTTLLQSLFRTASDIITENATHRLWCQALCLS